MKKEYYCETLSDGTKVWHESGPSFEDIPGGVIIQTPLCKVCLKHDEESWTCNKYGKMPKVYQHCLKYDCTYFEPDKENESYDEVEKEITNANK